MRPRTPRFATCLTAPMLLALPLRAQEETKVQFAPAEEIRFKPGSGITFDGGDEFRLTLLTYVQLQYSDTWGEDVEDVQNFRVRRARPSFTGHAFRKEIQYTLRLDLVDADKLVGSGADQYLETNSVVKDAWVQWDFDRREDHRIGVRMGQSKTFHGLEATETDAALFFVDRTVTTTTFSDARSRGIWFHGNHADTLRWTMGAQNGDVAASNPAAILDAGEEADNADNELTYVASLNLDPLGDYVGKGATYESFREGDLGHTPDLRGTLGTGFMWGNGRLRADPEGPDIESSSWNLNTSWKLQGFWTQAERFVRADDDEGGNRNGTGSYVAIGYVLPKAADSNLQWGIGGRIADVDQEDGPDTRDHSLALSAFYRGHALKTQLEYVRRDYEAAAGRDDDSHILRVQFQVMF